MSSTAGQGKDKLWIFTVCLNVMTGSSRSYSQQSRQRCKPAACSSCVCTEAESYCSWREGAFTSRKYLSPGLKELNVRELVTQLLQEITHLIIDESIDEKVMLSAKKTRIL